MTAEYWRAKIWGLLHDPVLKALHNNSGRGGTSFYEQLEVMQPWINAGRIPGRSQSFLCQHLLIADYLTSASDRSAIGSTSSFINYAPGDNREKGLQITHLLSAKKQEFKVNFHDQLISGKRKDYLENKEQELLNKIPEHLQQQDIQENIPKIKELYWWLWRCLPQVTCDIFKDSSLMLMPAETRIPDASIWSHVSMTAALAGGFAGYDLTLDEVKKWTGNKDISHPHLAVFSFTPVQELIKSSRKMRDFWAGSWLLHYLSAKVCWILAKQYGPDALLYPSLYQQPLIDHWLVKEYPKFKEFIGETSPELLLTAGFPNVIVLVLPEGKVQAAMQTAQQTLLEAWLEIGDSVLKELQNKRHWMQGLNTNHTTWKGWLRSQWQFYWTALPIGKGKEFKTAAIPDDVDELLQPWLDQQNKAYNVSKKQELFQKKELEFLREAYKKRLEEQGRKFSVNVGSWWPYIFDATRAALASVKNARNWELPTAFGPRSTISGIGPVVNPGNKDKDKKDWMTEGDTQHFWQHQAGFFDGREQLNATEGVKRCLHKVLPKLLGIESLEISYPDLTSGVAGYLKNNDSNHLQTFQSACREIQNWVLRSQNKIPDAVTEKWGIPWIDKENPHAGQYHPRLLNTGWLLEELDYTDDNKAQYTKEIQEIISKHYPNNNPSDWYVLAAGDGDSMSEWLKGTKLKTYGDYIPDGFAEKVATAERPLTQFPEFLKLTKRMGPSTHSALSRALLDFSNRLVPYLTQVRYAGKLIYAGGDDVLPYLNLWEWDNWLWDIRQCFRGAKDPHDEFSNDGDYWKYLKDNPEQVGLVDRPLFTMGSAATISFGIVIAHHSVPLAIALESLWEAEEKAKEHFYIQEGKKEQKDAVQVRVLYGNGNTLKSTAKFDVFSQWQKLITHDLESSIFEQAASLWSQHPAPSQEAIEPWTRVFCDRRDQFQNKETAKAYFQKHLADFLKALFITTQTEDLDTEIQNWLKLAAFIKRNRHIKLGGDN